MSNITLSLGQARVLASMIEKQYTTPANYPLSINAIRVACNQKNNRDPVVDYQENQIFDFLQELQEIGFAELDTFESSRTAKYRQTFSKNNQLSHGATVILCELLNRGPQTEAELRSRCSRMHTFKDAQEIEHILQELSKKTMVVMIERQAGTKEHRWGHLFSGIPIFKAPAQERLNQSDSTERIALLESQLAELTQRVAMLEAR